MERRPRSSCGCTYRIVGTPPEVVMDVSACLYPEVLKENEAFHKIAANYGEQGIVSWTRQQAENLTHLFVVGPPCPQCKQGRMPLMAKAGVYALAYDYQESFQAAGPEDVPKKLMCVRCGALRALPAIQS